MKFKRGITLIGMPWSGKTTIGPIIGEKLGWDVYDLDDKIMTEQHRSIAEIVAEDGDLKLRKLEAEAVAKLKLRQKVLVTGGSIVYASECHAKIRHETTVVWLDVPLYSIHERMANDSERASAIVGLQEIGLDQLFEQRKPLYAALAGLVIDCSGKNPETIANEIIEKISQQGWSN